MSMQVISRFAEACRLGRKGKAKEAIAALCAGLDEGSWYNPGALAEEPSLAAAGPEIDPIIRECEERLRRRAAETRPLCLVLSPSSALWDQQTLMVLHRRGDSARHFAEHWRPLVNEGWTLVVPQSSQPWDSASWCWDHMDVARREVRNHLEECRTRRGLDLARLIVAGASEGAPLAAETANEAGLPWLCVIPIFPRGYDVTALAAVPRHTRGAFLTGENDPQNAQTRLVVETLESAGASVVTRTMTGVGHELPHDFSRHASVVLKSLELG